MDQCGVVRSGLHEPPPECKLAKQGLADALPRHLFSTQAPKLSGAMRKP